MKKRFYSIIIFLFFFASLHSQDSLRILELQQSLHSAKADSTKARLLISLGYEFRNSKPDSGVFYTKQGLQIATHLNDTKKIISASTQIGKLYYKLSDDDSSMKYYNEALKLTEQIKDTASLSNIHISIGYTLSRTDRTSEMLSEFITALQLAEKINNKVKTSDALYALSDYYMNLEEFAKAQPYLRKSLEIDKELGNESFIATDYQYLGRCVSGLDSAKEAEHYFQNAIDMFGEQKDNFHLATAYSYLANFYNSEEDYKKSVENYLLAQQLMKELGAQTEFTDITDNIANEYLRMKDYNNAEKYAQQGLRVAEEIHADQQVLYLNKTMATLSALRGNYEDAFNYESKVPVLMDSLNAREQKDKMVEMLTKFETEEKEKENHILKAENETAIANLDRNHAWLIAAGITLLLLSLLTYIIFRNRQTKVKNIKVLEDLNEKLEKQKEEISRMNTILQLRALRAQMNPHFIFNCMSSIQECMLTDRLDDANNYLSKLSKLLRMVLNHSDDESVTLDTELEMLKLYLELESVRLKDGFRYEIEVDEEIYSEEINVPTLVLQPFAENAIWHGLLNKPSDRELKIHIEVNHETLRCTVRDNGVGRVKAAEINSSRKKHQSKGMELVKKRLAILREKSQQPKTGFNIQDLYDANHEPEGTMVEIILPISEL